MLRPAGGLRLLGEYQGSGFTEPRSLVRRGDGQVIQLSRLLYLVLAAIAAGDADGGWSADRVAARVSETYGREVTADNVWYLVTGKLAPLGMLRTPTADKAATERSDGPAPTPRTNPLLGLRVRGVLLRPRASAAVGDALAWLHYPPLTGVVLAGFFAFEAWLFGVHGAVGPLLDVLRRPVLLLAVAGLTLASLVCHEFGHASACRYGGARPGVIGFGLYLVWPSLYTDVTDAYRLDRAGRLRTDLGGVYFNAIFILGTAGCYAITAQPVFLAAAFLGNVEIAQQLVPVVRMDGYFILGDLAGIPDLLGLLAPIVATVLPGAAAARTAARARGLRRGPRVIVTVWTLVAVPLLAAIAGYTLWHLPAMVSTAARSFTSAVAATDAAFAAGHFAAGLAAGLAVILLIVPAAGLCYLLGMLAARAAVATVRLGARRSPRMPRSVIAVVAASTVLASGVALAVTLPPSPARHDTTTAAPTGLGPRKPPEAAGRVGTAAGLDQPPASSPTGRTAWPPTATRRPRRSSRYGGTGQQATSPALGAPGQLTMATSHAQPPAAPTPATQPDVDTATPPAKHAPATRVANTVLPHSVRPRTSSATSTAGGSLSARRPTSVSGGTPSSRDSSTPSSCAAQFDVSLLTIGVLCARPDQ